MRVDPAAPAADDAPRAVDRGADVVTIASLRPPASPLEAGRRLDATARHAVAFMLAGRRVRVATAWPELTRRLARRYGDFPRLASDAPAELTLRAGAVAGDFVVRADDGAARGFPLDACDLERRVFFVDAALGAAFFERMGPLSLHAAVVAFDGVAAAIAGRSRAGKTTTTLACGLAGAAVFSDERCVLEDGLVHPFPRELTLRPGGRRLVLDGAALPAPLRARLDAAPDGHDVNARPSRLFAVGRGRPPLRALLLLLDGVGERPSLEPADLVAELPRVMRCVMQRETGLERPRRVLDELAATRVFRLRLGTPATTAEAIRARLASLA